MPGVFGPPDFHHEKGLLLPDDRDFLLKKLSDEMAEAADIFPGFLKPFTSEFKPLDGVKRADVTWLPAFRSTFLSLFPSLDVLERIIAVTYEPGAKLPRSHYDHVHSAPVSTIQLSGGPTLLSLYPERGVSLHEMIEDGDGVTFDGSVRHSLTNRSHGKRISLILPGVDLRDLEYIDLSTNQLTGAQLHPIHV